MQGSHWPLLGLLVGKRVLYHCAINAYLSLLIHLNKVFEALVFLDADYFGYFLRRNFPFLKEDFPGGSDGKVSACNVGDLGSILPGSGRSSGEGNGNPLQYSGLENPMGGEAW